MRLSNRVKFLWQTSHLNSCCRAFLGKHRPFWMCSEEIEDATSNALRYVFIVDGVVVVLLLLFLFLSLLSLS